MTKIIFIPTWKCNLSCGYCDYATFPSEDCNYKLQAFDQTLEIGRELTAQEWLTQMERFDPFLLEMTGGEPTVYKELDILLKGLPEASRWAVTSNTLLSDQIRKLPVYNCRCWTASYHFHSDKTFIGNLEYLRGQGAHTSVTIVFTPDNWKIARKKSKMFAKKGFPVNIHPLLKQGFSWHDHKRIYDKMQNMQKHYLINVVNLISDEWSVEQYPKCDAGTDKYFLAQPDGTILRCYSEILRGGHGTPVQDFQPDQRAQACENGCIFPCDKQIARKTRI